MPYSYLTFDDAGLNSGIASGSYFPKNLQELYDQKFVSQEKYFGTADSDLIEFSLYNSAQEVVAFNRVVPTVSYAVISGTYNDINNKLSYYNFAKPFTNFVKYNNSLLLDTQNNLKKVQISPGLYYVLYNFVRNVAGNNKNKLVIKEISPSKTELRLSFAFNPTLSAEGALDATKTSAFADKKYLFLQISTLVNQVIDNNPISQNFVNNTGNFDYVKIAQNLGLKSTAELQTFINDTYIGFDKIQNLSTVVDQTILQTSKFIGIDDQLKNFTYSYNSTEFSEADILLAFETIVTKVSQDRILQKTSINPVQLQNILDLFVKVIYTDWLLPQMTMVLDDYANRFFGLYKNALNFGNGELIKILTHTSYLNPSDGRINVQIKLDAPLPLNFDVQTTCWISNISIAPVYFKTNLFVDPISRKVYLNGVNFDVVVDTANPTNDAFANHTVDTLTSAKANLQQKINDLLIDYDVFNNFIVYSSAELRTKIAKNKILEYNKTENQKNAIAARANSANSAISASYSLEKQSLVQNQINLLNSFDEYESYLFFNTSSIDDKIADGVVYDKDNLDSLINQLPAYIQEDGNSADYLKFTSMVGHFFDNILVYIKKFPKTYPLGVSELSDYPKNFLDELLNSFSWNTNNFKLQNSDVTQYLFNQSQASGSLSSSYFDYGKTLLNRFANNLPYIYKTKGTATSLELLTALFGIPSELIQIREYGSTDVNVNRINYFDYNDVLYLTKLDSDKYLTFNYTGSEYKYVVNSPYTITNPSLTNPTTIVSLTSSRGEVEEFSGFNTFEGTFRFKSNNYYANQKIPVVKKVRNGKIDWLVYIKKTKQTDSGILVFDFHPDTGLASSNFTSSLKTDELPFLNGDMFTFMVTRDFLPGATYDTLPNAVNATAPIIYTIGTKTYTAITSSYTSSNSAKFAPLNYTLSVNQYEGSLLNFHSDRTRTLTFAQNQYFSSGSYYIGNYNSDVEFRGNIDKIKVFVDTLAADDFSEHSYNVDSISTPDKNTLYRNLLYFWSFDTPIDLWSHTSSIDYKWVPNQNIYYQLSGSPYTNAFKAYNFTGELVTQPYPSCVPAVQSKFPYQFDRIVVKQAINANNFGPNYKNNVKINKINEFATSNLVPYDYSTKTNDNLGSDSNVVGFYISPYTYLENKIEKFLGKDGITDVIGDPKYLTKQNYPELKKLQLDFSLTNQKYIYPQEFYSTYKFYIDFSIFDYIQNVVPNRASLKRGLLIEPSLLERKKFNYKDLIYTVPTFSTASFSLSNIASFSASYTTGGLMSIAARANAVYSTDHNTHNFSRFEIPDIIDNRDFMFAKYGKYIFTDVDGFNIRDTHNIPGQEYYQVINNNGGVVGFTSSFDRVEAIGSGSITGSDAFTNRYYGIQNSGYSQRHLSKINMPGSRRRYQAVSGSNYKINNGVKTLALAKTTFYTYIKGENDYTTTVNRNGLPNGSQPVITIPGFLSFNISSSTFPVNGTTTGSIGSPNSLFVQVPLTASMANSASLNKYILNL